MPIFIREWHVKSISGLLFAKLGIVFCKLTFSEFQQKRSKMNFLHHCACILCICYCVFILERVYQLIRHASKPVFNIS